MKYYSEKLNKLFDTQEELEAEENKGKSLDYWELCLSNAISELSKADDKLGEEIEKCVKEIGEKECDKLLDKIFAEKAVVKDEGVCKDKKSIDEINKAWKGQNNKTAQELNSKLNSLLKEENKPQSLNVCWNGIFSLLDEIFKEDE